MIRTLTSPSTHLLRLTGILLVALASAASGATDLEVRSVSGPGRAHSGTLVLMHLDVGVNGEPPSAGFVAEIVLSFDDKVDASDLVVGNLASDYYEPQGAVAQIPSDLADAVLYWGVRVLPAAGETDTTNNQLIGNPCQFVSTDLQLRDASPVELAVPEGHGATERVVVTVDNVGTPESLLIFTAAALTPAPWLTLSPATGFSVSGGESAQVELLFECGALSPGTYQTTLRFTNFIAPLDFQDLSVTLQVGPAQFIPGDSLLGEISTPLESDEAEFAALQGTLLRLKVRSRTGTIRPHIEIIDPDGSVAATIRCRHSHRAHRSTVKIRKTGTYLLRISGQGQSTGRYRVTTERKLPSKARPRALRLRPGSSAETASCSVLLMEQATLDLRIKPNQSFAGPLGLLLTTPDGTLFDGTGLSTTAQDGSLVIEGMSPILPGRYTFQITGYGTNPTAATRIALFPVQPEKGRGKIYLK